MTFAKFQKILITILLALSTFYGGYYLGKRGYIFEIRKNPPEIKIINQSPTSQIIDFDLFWKVWDEISQKYLERPVDTQKMLYGAIKGMVESLDDPYTSFLSPEINEVVNNSLEGVYEGVGAELGIKDEQLIVVAPLDGSPAKEAGLQSQDKILEIEGESTLGISLTEAVSKIRGPAGTISTLKLQRGNGEPFVVRIKRGKIVVESVKWEDKGDGTAYIRVSRFGADTNKEWIKVVSEVNVKMKELDAIILDLRENPGGYLDSAVFIAGEFFKDKVVVYQESATGELISRETDRVGVFEGLPLIVLIDEGSASASEILAAALDTHVDTTLVGTKTFGKGTIQDAIQFDDGSGLHITIAKWLTPKKEWIHEKGIEPEVQVDEPTAEEIENEIDKQLDKAIELADEY